MQMIDVALIDYDAELITENGKTYVLNDLLQSLSWEEQDGQLSQKATLKLVNSKVGTHRLMSLAKLNCMIRIYGKWGSGRKKLFEGFIWEWQYVHAQSRDFTISAYDPLIRLQQCKDFKYFLKGLSTPAILGNICGDWGISLSYQWKKQMTHEKKVFNGEAISDMIIKLLDEVKQQTGEKYIALYKDGKLTVSGYGTNKDIYEFKGSNTISTSDKLSLNNLVTRVKIIGKSDDKGRSKVDAVVNGNLKYGVLQEIIKRDSDKDLGKAKSEAQATLQERGKPEESIQVNAPDLPFLRRGDAVEMSAGNLNGTFYVIGVSHNAATKQMTMTLVRKKSA